MREFPLACLSVAICLSVVLSRPPIRDALGADVTMSKRGPKSAPKTGAKKPEPKTLLPEELPAKKPVARRPPAKRPPAEKLPAKLPAAKQPATKKSTAKKPVAKTEDEGSQCQADEPERRPSKQGEDEKRRPQARNAAARPLPTPQRIERPHSRPAATPPVPRPHRKFAPARAGARVGEVSGAGALAHAPGHDPAQRGTSVRIAEAAVRHHFVAVRSPTSSPAQLVPRCTGSLHAHRSGSSWLRASARSVDCDQPGSRRPRIRSGQP